MIVFETNKMLYGILIFFRIGGVQMNALEELEEAKAVYEGLQQMYSGEMVDGETVMEELKNKYGL